MPEVFTTPGDMRDGCGPYGRHLTGAVDWQKRYSLSHYGVAGTNLLMSAAKDYAFPVPPPSEDTTLSTLRTYVVVGGTASFIRMSIYDATDMAALALVADSGEAAANTSTAFVEINLAANIVLRRNGRYLSILCARGVVLPTILICTNEVYPSITWFGTSPTIVGGHLGRIIYDRANAAFPALYNGVFSLVDSYSSPIDGKLP